MTLLTADDVLTVKFGVSSLKEGYKQDEINVFLDDVITTIRESKERLGTSQESSGPSLRKTKILLTAEGARDIRFLTTRRSGYCIDQVDAFTVQVPVTMEALEAQVHTSSFTSQPGTGTGTAYDGACGSGAYGMNLTQIGYAPGDTDGTDDAQHAEAITQHDQYIAQLQQRNVYLRAELEPVQHRLGTTGY